MLPRRRSWMCWQQGRTLESAKALLSLEARYTHVIAGKVAELRLYSIGGAGINKGTLSEVMPSRRATSMVPVVK